MEARNRNRTLYAVTNLRVVFEIPPDVPPTPAEVALAAYFAEPNRAL